MVNYSYLKRRGKQMLSSFSRIVNYSGRFGREMAKKYSESKEDELYGYGVCALWLGGMEGFFVYDALLWFLGILTMESALSIPIAVAAFRYLHSLYVFEKERSRLGLNKK
jgi:hypothetical protein